MKYVPPLKELLILHDDAFKCFGYSFEIQTLVDARLASSSFTPYYKFKLHLQIRLSLHLRKRNGHWVKG